jgi:hypothetical protein
MLLMQENMRTAVLQLGNRRPAELLLWCVSHL